MIRVTENYEDSELQECLQEMTRIFLDIFPNGCLDTSPIESDESIFYSITPIINYKSRASDGEVFDAEVYLIRDPNSSDITLADNKYGHILVSTEDSKEVPYSGKLKVKGTLDDVLDAWSAYCHGVYKILRKFRRKNMLSDVHLDLLQDL